MRPTPMPSTSNPLSWLEPLLTRAATLSNDATPSVAPEELYLGIDLGTSDVVTMAVDAQGTPMAVCLEWADVVRDGVVLNFIEAVRIVRKQLAQIESQLGRSFTHAATSFPPGTDPRISANVIEAAGLQVSEIIDEPTAVARLLGISQGAVVDIGGGTTGVALIENGKVVYSGDEATGGHHVTLCLAGALKTTIEAAQKFKHEQGQEAWSIARPVFEKMTDIVQSHIGTRVPVKTLYLSGGSCALPGVQSLFSQAFPGIEVILPQPCLYLTPLAIASSARSAR
ncbi:MAG: ethanolamine utilization protein EutJ [Betaproteobacteria bacterium]